VTGSRSTKQWLRGAMSSVWEARARAWLTARSNHVSWFEPRRRFSSSSELCSTGSFGLCK